VILLEEFSLSIDSGSNHGRHPTLRAVVTSLAESAPVIVIGSAEHQSELTALLASGVADFVIRSETSHGVAVGLLERPLRHRLLRSSVTTHLVRLRHRRSGTPQTLSNRWISAKCCATN
jgi:hypothetical protein